MVLVRIIRFAILKRLAPPLFRNLNAGEEVGGPHGNRVYTSLIAYNQVNTPFIAFYIKQFIVLLFQKGIYPKNFNSIRLFKFGINVRRQMENNAIQRWPEFKGR